MVTEPELIGGISVLGDSVANIRLGSRVNPDIGSVSAPAPVLNGSEWIVTHWTLRQTIKMKCFEKVLLLILTF